MCSEISNEARLAIFNTMLQYLSKNPLLKKISFLKKDNSWTGFIPVMTDCISPVTLQPRDGQCYTSQGGNAVTL